VQNQRCVKKRNGGFTLIELMIVVGIIAILATLALPRFAVFNTKALRTEAGVNLKIAAALQETYFIEERAYAPQATIGHSLRPNCNSAGSFIGFELTHCEKVNYDYSSIFDTGDFMFAVSNTIESTGAKDGYTWSLGSGTLTQCADAIEGTDTCP
jgi:prepilin-type N-terminal cleavage/methylation domain-containing protein